MAEIEREPFEALFKQEPANPAPADAAEWRRRYSLLLEMLEQQLRHTREFMNRAPDPLRKYLDSQNVRILDEEINAFRDRLAHWEKLAGGQGD